ncbi:MAG: hypothetical protein EZS28_018253 [Streblomastix strix]|uniref:HNH nuclease domain-containing protein n=1 Tax=Streblomastix strix TaxID=222440 RepID=A0A5J4VV03_9EUKA|nr:MAG: hypothetical protein EZS28_018253 [Streblomastix strix]
MENNNQQQFVQLDVEPEFEITTTQPWRIRRIVDGFEPTINQSPEGYMQVGLNSRIYGLHRLVALQFILNDDPEHKTKCDHRSQIRTDNSLGNLRWVTPSQNCGYYFVHAKDQMGQEVQAANDEIIQGLKYVVGATARYLASSVVKYFLGLPLIL